MIARRVILLLDEGNDPEDGLGAALRVETGARTCVGLFVANEDLRRFAGWSGAVPVRSPGRGTGDPGPLGPWLAARREAIRERCVAVARGLRVEVEWRVRDPAGTAWEPQDLLVVPEPDAATWVGSPWPRLLGNPPCDVLFVNRPWASGSRIVTLDDGAADGRATLERAREIAAREALPLVSLPLPPSPDVAALVAACVREDARLLVLPHLPALDGTALLERLLELVECSLLVCAAAHEPAPARSVPDGGAASG